MGGITLSELTQIGIFLCSFTLVILEVVSVLNDHHKRK